MVLDRAQTAQLVRQNVAAHVRPPRNQAPAPDLERWDVADLLRFRQTADLDPWAGAWRLTLSGLRRSEVMGLRWSDVDWDAGTVTIRQSRGDRRPGHGDRPAEVRGQLADRAGGAVAPGHPGAAEAAPVGLPGVGGLGPDPLDPAGEPIYPGAYSDGSASWAGPPGAGSSTCTRCGTRSRTWRTPTGSPRPTARRCWATPSRSTSARTCSPARMRRTRRPTGSAKRSRPKPDPSLSRPRSVGRASGPPARAPATKPGGGPSIGKASPTVTPTQPPPPPPGNGPPDRPDWTDSGPAPAGPPTRAPNDREAA